MEQRIITFPTAKKKSKPKNMTSDGRRCVRVDVGTNPKTGKRIRKAFYGKTLKEAQAKADEFKRAKEDGVDLVAQRQPLSDWIDTWLETYGQRGGFSNQTGYRRNAEKLRASLGHLKLNEVRQMHIQRLADAHSDYSKSGVNKLRLTIQQIFRSAVANRLIAYDPTVGVVWTNQGEGTHRALSSEEIALLAQHAPGSGFIGLAAMLMLFGGLRRGEVVALRWEDVDPEAGLIHVRHGVHYEGSTPVFGSPKTKSSVRDVPILPPLKPLLAVPGEGWILKNQEGKQPSRSEFEWEWDQLMKRLGLSVRTHDLRHTFVTMLYDAGVDVKTTQKYVGHASPSITMQIYTHLSAEQEKSSLDSINRFVSKYCR